MALALRTMSSSFAGGRRLVRSRLRLAVLWTALALRTSGSAIAPTMRLGVRTRLRLTEATVARVTRDNGVTDLRNHPLPGRQNRALSLRFVFPKGQSRAAPSELTSALSTALAEPSAPVNGSWTTMSGENVVSMFRTIVAVWSSSSPAR